MLILVIILILIILTQDIQIFPLFLYSLIYKKKQRNKETIPKDVKSTFLKTKDNKYIELWHVPSEENKEAKSKKGTVLIFHGNGELVDTNVDQQRWFAQNGWDSYSFDYRGYGRSTGWPNEKGIYIDSDTVYSYLLEEKQIKPEDLIIVGYSVGSAPAARLASIINPKTLLIIAGYSNIKDVARDRVIFRPIVPFIWSKLSTKSYISKLNKTNLILTHGKTDKIIKFYHMGINAKHYKGTGKVDCIEHMEADHLEIFWKTKEQILEKLNS